MTNIDSGIIYPVLQLTHQDTGNPLYINPAQVAVVAPAYTGTGAEVALAGDVSNVLNVSETVGDVLELLQWEPRRMPEPTFQEYAEEHDFEGLDTPLAPEGVAPSGYKPGIVTSTVTAADVEEAKLELNPWEDKRLTDSEREASYQAALSRGEVEEPPFGSVVFIGSRGEDEAL